MKSLIIHRDQSVKNLRSGKRCNSPKALEPLSLGSSSVNMDSFRAVSDSSSSPSAPSYSSETASQSEDQNDAMSPQSLQEIQRNILSRSMSRCGRDQQRFVDDPETGLLFRLTTGTVPIMPDGKIVLVSSSRADCWILPKG